MNPRIPNPVPEIRFPDALPVSARRDDIAQAIRSRQVVVVCGETGSGKTTQLPKIALSLGRGIGAGGSGLIGHTQPRRIAATSVARRIAAELSTPLGEVVGYRVRFQDRFQPGASVKLMTDGILLAETGSDPLLYAYDTLIVDEAHERSLNIDFLLGYLKRILPRRPDLKVIVTSATIDAERFAAHFADAAGPAPVLQVSGRLFPVELRWRPVDEKRDEALNTSIADALDELWRGSPGAGAADVLVFLPGEREIRDAAVHLRKHLAASGPRGQNVEVLPLFARLSQAEQDRAFEPHSGRRVVLATNVAETSLTVPGIRYVIDSGLARVKRYSYRSKVEQLQIEPVARSAADQRAGRCGRVADGVCIRLYDEAEFAARPRFTDPEILRSSLAGVILRMRSLGLGAVEEFPFLEAPPRKAVADGYALLAELNAVDEAGELTKIGRELARLPLDPRVGRMILEARERHALAEVLIIAAALSGQDVRDRPLEQAQLADERHRPFDDERSEFVGYLKLWQWLDETRGGHRTAAQPGVHGGGEPGTPADRPRTSHRQFEQRLREHFISPRRVREWRDIHSQLHTVVAEQGWRLDAAPASYEQIHVSMLAGLLGNVGFKSEDDEWYLGARGIRFWRHPGAHLSKRPGRWIVAAELVETTRLYGRGIAAIDPQWIPPVAGHLLKTQLLEPHWEKKAAEVIALERATLYGIVVYANRRVNYGNVDPAAAREIFIREALVHGEAPPEWERRLPFLAHNRALVRQIEELEHKARRQDVLVDDDLIEAFYDRHVPADVASGAAFERWYRAESRRTPALLELTRDALMRHDAAGITTAAFPKTVRIGGVDCGATYLHAPGDPKDGVTVTLPIYALNPASEARAEWLVPGMLPAKVLALLRGLPQRPRARLVPLPAYAAEFVERTPFGEGSLVEALVMAVRERVQGPMPVQAADLHAEALPPHHLMNFRVVDEHGRQLGQGRHLAALKAEWGAQARSAFQALAALKGRALPSAKDGEAAANAPGGAAAAPAATAASGRSRLVAQTAARGRTSPQPESTPDAAPAAERYTAWTFGPLPELMEIRRGGHSLVGFPALADRHSHVEIEVFDDPVPAAAAHHAGLRRLFAIACKATLDPLARQLPALRTMAAAYLPLGTQEELRAQILEVALDRAFLGDPLPADEAAFKVRLEAGRPRLVLIAHEIEKTAAAVLTVFAAASRKLRDSRPPKEAADDLAAQLERLVGKRFVVDTPYAQLTQLPRYLEAIVLRLDKLRADPARDAARLAELRPIEQRYLRRLGERRGAADARLAAFRWMIEELRVGLFAQELKTPMPVSAKRLEKAWAQIGS